MNKFEISEKFSRALDKQENSLKLSTAVTLVGFGFVKAIQLITVVAVEAINVEELVTPEGD